jgi:hypothetical protein
LISLKTLTLFPLMIAVQADFLDRIRARLPAQEAQRSAGQEAAAAFACAVAFLDRLNTRGTAFRASRHGRLV